MARAQGCTEYDAGVRYTPSSRDERVMIAPNKAAARPV